ncbi:hypothetical protein PQQ96_20205, partial [Paraburkholderia sediminicola]|uniref:hypothetical protein n=1 Tax=Paraburkholderia sediminicola TaxID=458836 RepID=UPI0038B746C8
SFLCGGRQRKVGAAPHGGNTNNPISIQGKANAIGRQTEQAQAIKPGKAQRHRHTEVQAPRRQTNKKGDN